MFYLFLLYLIKAIKRYVQSSANNKIIFSSFILYKRGLGLPPRHQCEPKGRGGPMTFHGLLRMLRGLNGKFPYLIDCFTDPWRYATLRGPFYVVGLHS